MTRHLMREAGSFERMFDELFDELLLNRWRLRTHQTRAAESQLVEHDDRYQVRVATGDADPRSLEVAVAAYRLMITLKAGSRAGLERVFTFSQPIELAGVKARWWRGVLTVVLPKRPAPSGERA